MQKIFSSNLISQKLNKNNSHNKLENSKNLNNSNL